MSTESATRYTWQSVHPYLLWVTAVMAGFGVLMVYDSSAVSAALRQKFSNQYFFLIRQGIWFCVGLAVMLTTLRLPVKKLRNWVFPGLAGIIILLILVLIPGIGVEAGGARRWLRLGPFSLQPGEITRLLLVFYLAHFLSIRHSRIHEFRNVFLPIAVVTGAIAMLLVAQPKTGSALILLMLTGLIVFAAGVPLWQLAGAALAASPLAILVYLRSDYISQRIDSWLHPAAHMKGLAFQSVQSLIAIGSGGFLGQGLGQGRQKLFYLPEAHTDFIFPVISEELGLLGSGLLLAGFGLILLFGIKTARASSDRFSGLLATGLTLMIILPAAINMMVATNLMPVTGVPLPFISYGGTALVTDMAAVGFIANIAAANTRHREKVLYHAAVA